MLWIIVFAVIGAVIFKKFPVFGLVMVAAAIGFIANLFGGDGGKIFLGATMVIGGYLIVAIIVGTILAKIFVALGASEEGAINVISWIFAIPIGLGVIAVLLATIF